MVNFLDANIFYKTLDVHYRGVQVDHGAVVDNVMNAVAGETLALMDCVVYQSDGKWDQCDADVEVETNGLCGIVLSSDAGALAVDNVFVVVLRGRIRDDTWGWTVGGRIYISPAVGQLTQVRPSAGGQFARCVGWAVTATEMIFDPDTYYETL